MKNIWLILLVLISGCMTTKHKEKNILEIYNEMPNDYIINNSNVMKSDGLAEMLLSDIDNNKSEIIEHINNDSTMLSYSALGNNLEAYDDTVQLVKINNRYCLVNYTPYGLGNDELYVSSTRPYVSVYDIESKSIVNDVFFSKEAISNNAKISIDLGNQEIIAIYQDKVETKTFKEIISKLNK